MMKRLLLFLFSLAVCGSSLPTLAAAQVVPARPSGSKLVAGPDDKSVLVYPNPSTGIVHVAINGFMGHRLELQVLNVIGSVVYRETITELNERYTKTLDFSKFANGLYYVKLDGDNASEMRKLIIR